ncbi:MAG: aminopeptidase, partial [Muribaculaceae bacterium]|nr:aminopeptidase [Muribaculaceae bacterium]
MQNLRISLAALGAAVCLSVSAQYGPGGLSQSDLKALADSYTPTTTDKAITNALASGSINTLALNQERMNNFDTHFSHKVPT